MYQILLMTISGYHDILYIFSRGVRNKNDPRGNPVQIIHVWPQYAKVLRGGKEDTVNLRDLAPLPTAPSDAETDSAPSTQPLEPPTTAEQPRSRYGRLLREPAYMQDYAKSVTSFVENVLR